MHRRLGLPKLDLFADAIQSHGLEQGVAAQHAAAEQGVEPPALPDAVQHCTEEADFEALGQAKAIEFLTSALAEKMTSIGERRAPTGAMAFSRRRRITFSTSMIASSTTIPMAMAIPPRVMVLMPAPV